jgi:uncharacterized protein
MCYILVGGYEDIMAHTNHPAIVRRLERADGHLQKIIEMIEAGKPCVQLAQQLQAVESAIENAKKVLIHDHIGHCLDESFSKAGPAGRAIMQELKSIARYLSRDSSQKSTRLIPLRAVGSVRLELTQWCGLILLSS